MSEHWKVAPDQIGLGEEVCSRSDSWDAAERDAKHIDDEGKVKYVKVRSLRIIESDGSENYYWCVVVPK
jgi:hypothetical protein